MELFKMLQMRNPDLAKQLQQDPKAMKSIENAEAERNAINGGTILSSHVKGVTMWLKNDTKDG